MLVFDKITFANIINVRFYYASLVMEIVVGEVNCLQDR